MQASKPNSWLYRYALLVALCSLVLIGSGAFLTSSRKASEAPDVFPASAAAGTNHLIAMAGIVGALTLGLAVWTLFAGKSIRGLAFATLIIFGLEGWTAAQTSAWNVVFHACLAPLFFSTLAVICLLLSSHWSDVPDVVADQGHGAVRLLTIAAPPLVLLQIALGAAYRHKTASVMPHMAGAMVVALLTLVASVMILQQYPAHRSLRAAATAVLSTVLVQVTLGVTAFVIELLDIGNSPWLIFATVSHVLVGSLTLAATLVLAMEVHRNVRPAVAQPIGPTG